MMLTIQKLRDGGYIVSDLNLLNPGRMSDFMFASADIDEALGYIKSQMSSPASLPAQFDGVQPGGLAKVTP